MLEHPLVDGADVDPLREVVEAGVRPAALALLDDPPRGQLTDALDAGEAEPDGARMGALRDGGEVLLDSLAVRTAQHPESHGLRTPR